MSLQLSERMRNYTENVKELRPNLILEIEGYSTIFGAVTVYKTPRFDEGFLFDDGLYFDQPVENPNSKKYISMEGTSSNISQQLNQDTGGSQSVARVSVELVDKNGEVTELVSPGFAFTDILGQKANLYLSFNDLRHPEDSILIHYGPIDGIKTKPGSIILDIASPEQQKRQKIFIKSTCKLSAAAFYQGVTIQDLTFKKKDYVTGTVTIDYNSGASLGSETIGVSTNTITITMADGQTTAGKIKQLIEGSAEANQLVEVTVTGSRDDAQTIISPTNLDTTSTLTVDSTEGFIVPSDSLEAYLLINDELMRYTGLTDTTFTGVTRAQLGSAGGNHQSGDEISSFYRLQDTPIDLGLKLMLSPNSDSDEISIKSFLDDPSGVSETGSIWFDDNNIEFNQGLVVGDFITVTNATTNNMSLEPIIGFKTSGLYSAVIVDVAVTLMTDTGTAVFKSKYDVLNEGLGMKMPDVDVARHEYFSETFASALPDMDFYIKDTVDGKEFISNMYQSVGMYTLPRQLAASVGMTLPPISNQLIPILDETNIYDTKSIVQSRNVNKNFYNAIVYKYEVDSVGEKYLKGLVVYSADSQNRISAFGNKPYSITSDGLRDTNTINTQVENLALRMLDRYQYGAELYSNVKVLFSSGFNIEIGDLVYFGTENMYIVNSQTGNRTFVPRLMEVVNKKYNIKSGEIVFDLLTTNFELEGRYGVVAPASIVGVGSTTTEIVITDSYNTTAVASRVESYKWQDYIGMKIRVHSLDFTDDEEVTLVSIDGYTMTVSPALSFTPSAGNVVTAPSYGSGLVTENETWKLMHVFLDPTIDVASGSSSTVFDVGGGDVSKLFVGSIIKVHNDDYSDVSSEVTITDITSNTITVSASLGFTPDNTYKIDLIGFANDQGYPYRII